MIDRYRLNEELRRMRELIRGDAQLLARFDRDGNNAIDGEEWERVRQLVVTRLEDDEAACPVDSTATLMELIDDGLAAAPSSALSVSIGSAVWRALAPVLLVLVLYLCNLTSFWGGLLFFMVAEVIRWIVVVVYRTSRELRPIVEFMGIIAAPLFSLAVLLFAPLLFGSKTQLFDFQVRTELIDTAFLYICYIPYAFLTLFIFPIFKKGID